MKKTIYKHSTFVDSQKYIDMGWVKLPENFESFTQKDKEKWFQTLAQQIKSIPKKAPVEEKFLGIKINHQQSLSLGNDFCILVNKYLPQVAVAIDIIDKCINNGLYTSEEFKKVTQLVDGLESYGSFVGFMEYDKIFTYEKTCLANDLITTWVDTINKMKVGDRGLSPLEKFFMAYNIVTSFEYNESDDRFESRSLISVLTSNKIVCVGYSALLTELCKQLGIECVSQMISINGSDSINHQNCAVRIKDDIYGVDGIYYSDPCFGSVKGNMNIAYALIPFGDLPNIFGDRLVIPKNSVRPQPLQFGIDEHFKKYKTTEQWQELFDEYKKKTLPKFMEFIDEATAGLKDNKHVFPPDDSFYDMIIDPYITTIVTAENLLLNDINGLNKDEYLQTLKRKIGEVILSFTNHANLEDFKRKIAARFLEFTPEANTYVYEALQHACIYDYANSQEGEVEKLKANSKPLTYSNTIKLLMNILSASGVPKDVQDERIKKLLVESADIALNDWDNPYLGENAISEFLSTLSKLPDVQSSPNGPE